MAHRHAFEAVDRTMLDIMCPHDYNASTGIFGGKTIVLGGDFRQILPIINRGSRGDIVAASLPSSALWSHCSLHTLTQNMILVNSENSEVVEFCQWILNLGEGRLPLHKLSDDEEEPTWIKIPDKFLISLHEDPIDDVIRDTFPDLHMMLTDRGYLKERAILATKNEIVDEINDRLLALIPGDGITYLSADRISPSSENIETHTLLYPVEFLNSLKFSGLPNHVLELKVGGPHNIVKKYKPSKWVVQWDKTYRYSACR